MPNELSTKENWQFLNKFEVSQPSSGSPCPAPLGAQNYYRISAQGDHPWNATIGCNDWSTTQWEASFKEVPFAVDTDTRSGGRRVHVHEYPSKEWWDNEDLGRLRQTISVEGYVFGDKSDLWAEMLFAACTSPLSNKSTTGAGMLYLPMRVPLWAVCQTVESTFSADRMGRLDFSMTFSVEPNLGEVPHGGVPTKGRRIKNVVQLSDVVQRATNAVVTNAVQHFDNAFTGTHPSAARTTAAEYIRGLGQRLRLVAKAVRLNEIAGAVVEFVAQRFLDNADAYANVQRTAINTLNRQAAVLSQRASGLSLYQQFMQGVAIRASTGEVLPATGKMGEGLAGMLWNALSAMQSGMLNPGDNSDDLAMALIPLTNLKPRIQRTLSAQQLSTASVRAELQLAETVCALVRRTSLAHSVMAGIRVQPAKQPDASLTRRRLLEQIDEEIALLPASSALPQSLRALRSSVTEFVGHYSVNGGASIKLPDSWKGKPLAAIAASVYGNNAAGRDLDLMRFNGISHPMFAPTQMVALTTHGMLLSTEL